MNPYPEDLRKKVIEALRHGLGKGDVVRGCSVGWGSPEKEDYGGECDEFLRAAQRTLVGGALGGLGDELRIAVGHPRIEERRMSGLEGILGRFLDGYEVSPTGVVLVKRLGGQWPRSARF